MKDRLQRYVSGMRMTPCLVFVLLLAVAMSRPAHVAAADPVILDPVAVLALADAPWRDRRSFVEALEEVVGEVELEMPRLPDAVRDEDPFLWSVIGSFGAFVPGETSSGAIVACSRYGLITRDRLAERNLSDPEVFFIFGATQAAPDDAEVWPDTGVARLACTMTWNDTRRVAILPEAPASAAMMARFGTVTRSDDRELLGENWRDLPPRFGEAGYSLVGQDGPTDTVVVIESARIELRVGHQQIRFRAFLLNGGM